jgi:hypothetical protein
MGTHVVIDDYGQVQKLLEHKMHLASRQAKATKDYSPMWEGVINLPDPSDATPAQQIEIVKQWCAEYEKMTGHKVVRADVHLDEGYIDEAGKPKFNAHAHVMCDRTDEKGKVKKLTSTVLREVQNMTAKVTTLKRGLDARTTGRKHIGHQNFRFDAEKNRVELDVEKSKTARIQKLFSDDTPIISGLKKELADGKAQEAQKAAEMTQLKEQYRLDRDALKASGIATQKDYQALKKAHEIEVADLKKELAAALSEAAKVPLLESKVAELTIENEALKAQEAPKSKTLPTPSPTLEKPVEPVFPRLTEQEFEELNARVVMEINPKVKAAARDVLVGGMLVKAAAAIQKLFPSLIFRAIKLLLGNYIAPLPPEPIQPDPTRVASRVPSKIPGRGVGR